MARQSATQHLDVLERASLVTVVRRGRQRLHYLNPAPIHEIEERWISGFDRPRLQAISAIRNQKQKRSPSGGIATLAHKIVGRRGNHPATDFLKISETKLVPPVQSDAPWLSTLH